MTYDEFFRKATGHYPYAYQRRLSLDGLPEALAVPTGAGKTAAVVLAWLFRLLEGSPHDTPRTLAVMLPLRTLVEQTHRSAERWRSELGLQDTLRIIVLMGGGTGPEELQLWRRNPHVPTLVIGTVDSLVSRALVRGYAQPRPSYPIDFALVTDDTHWVVDEVQLAAQATSTARQLDTFRRRLGLMHPGRLTCMSATLPRGPLDTIDNPYDGAAMTLGDEDITGPLARRLEATRRVNQLAAAKPAEVAQALVAEHRPGTLTAAVLNTVRTATDIAKRVRKLAPGVEVLLLHSRFRGVDRAPAVGRLTDPLPPPGRIVISTQVIEAGVDLDAATLFTELAPWTSICQRAGRCNRAGTTPGASLQWFSPLAKGPYEVDDLDAAREALVELEGQQVRSQDLLGRDVRQSRAPLTLLRRRDFDRLFDTAPDLSGSDLDVSMFIRPTDDVDVTVAWVDGADMADLRAVDVPGDPWRCSVPLAEARSWLGQHGGPRGWTYDPGLGTWRILGPGGIRKLRPNHLVLVDREGGGYRPEVGFDPKSTASVPLRVKDDSPRGTPVMEGVAQGLAEDAGSTQQIHWQRLDEHLIDARRQARELVSVLDRNALGPDVRTAVEAAAYLHDLGKSFAGWQTALLTANADSSPPPGDGPWAKSPGRNRLRFLDGDGKTRTGFRHELVSVLHLRTPEGREHLSQLGVPEEHHNLCIYLVGAHHGHLRVQPRDPLVEGRRGTSLMGLHDGERIPETTINEMTFPAVEVDLGMFGMGRPDSWSGRSLDLLAAWGPFRLAWMEMVVRMADWRSSAGDPPAKEV